MFTLHPRLAADTVPVTEWSLCRVLLMNDAHYPWLVLVPEVPDAVDLHDLDARQGAELMVEVQRASRVLHERTGAHKMNVAALGNVVSQLHVHVIARFESDPAWPRPVWGVVPVRPYAPAELDTRVAELRAALQPRA
jgi:diadenosine tetraphosphate (Ap4A) HIT family hydrolase